MNTWTSLDPASIMNSVVGGIVVIVILALPSFSRRITRKVLSINHRWELLFNRSQLNRLDNLKNNPDALQQFLQQQTLWAIALLGVGMALSSAILLTSSIKFLPAVLWVFGLGIYFISIHAIGTAYQLGEKYESLVDRLRRRIALLESLIDRKD